MRRVAAIRVVVFMGSSTLRGHTLGSIRAASVRLPGADGDRTAPAARAVRRGRGRPPPPGASRRRGSQGTCWYDGVGGTGESEPSAWVIRGRRVIAGRGRGNARFVPIW